MASFLQSIFKKFSGDRAPRAPQVWLGAFGKHPGWNDHIDDLGLETNELIAIKRVFYVQGIGGNIDAGAWDNLAEDQRIPLFRHVFVWRTRDNVVVGRLWSSSDGKGRTRYPMFVCAQCTGLALPWVLEQMAPRLEKIEASCVATKDAGEVRKIIDSARLELRELLKQNEAAQLEQIGFANPLVTLAGRPEMGENHKGLLSVLYQVEREMAAFRPNREERDGKSTAPRHLRVPRCGADPSEVLLLWVRFLLGQLDASTPVSVILPLDEQWVDLIVGEPTVSQFFCVRASPKKVPLTTDIPYTLDPEFVERSNRAIMGA